MSDDQREEQAQEQTPSMLDEQAEERIWRVWHDGRWFFSVIDVVGLLTDTPKPRQYWFDMKRYVHSEGFIEVSEKVRQLKMPSTDGKQRLTVLPMRKLSCVSFKAYRHRRRSR